MGSDGSAGKNGRMLRLHRPDLHVRVLCFQYFADTGDSAACSDSGTETVDGAVRLLQDLKRRTGSVDRRVGGILELLRNENPRVFFCHTKRSVQALLDTGADIA